MLRNAKPVVDRIRELQEQALARVDRKLDISRERVGRNLDLASRIAQEQGNAQAIVASETAIAKVFGLAKLDDQYNPTDFNNAKSMSDLGRMLLQSVGLNAPSDDEILAAIAANDTFVETLERIRDNHVELDMS